MQVNSSKAQEQMGHPDVVLLPGAGLVEYRPAVPVDLSRDARDFPAVVTHVGPVDEDLLYNCSN